MKKWPLQLRRSAPDGMLGSSNGTSLQQEQEMTLIQERTLPSSPSPLYSGHSKASGFVKGGGLGQSSGRKQLMGGPPVIDHPRGMLQCVQSISFISISVDHSLHLVFQADSASPGSFQFPCFTCYELPHPSVAFILLESSLFSVHFKGYDLLLKKMCAPTQVS